MTRLPSPQDFDLDWGDIALIIKDLHPREAEKKLIHRFYLHETVARAWLAGVKQYAGVSR